MIDAYKKKEIDLIIEDLTRHVEALFKPYLWDEKSSEYLEYCNQLEQHKKIESLLKKYE